MPFKDYEQVAAPPLELPIGGKVYRIPAMGIRDGIELTLALRPDVEGEEPAAKMTNERFSELALGSALEEMRADNVPAPAVDRAALTAWTDHHDGRAVAEMMWETDGRPELLAAYTAAKSKTALTGSPSTDADGTTRPPASTSGTSSRKATRPRKPRKSAAGGKSPGSSSSSSSA